MNRALRVTLGLTAALLTGCGSETAVPPAMDGPPASDTVLQRTLEDAVQGFGGDVGIYVRHLPSGRSAEIWADTVFPTASLIKLPILLVTFDRIARGDLDYHQTLTYRDSLLYPGEDLLGSFRDGESVDLSKVVLLMITTSDNTASLWLQSLAGTGTEINAWLGAHGFRHTRVNSRTPGREAERERWGWGQTTPREMAELLVMVREGRAVNPGASDEMYRALTRIYWNDEALSEIPPTIQVASKQGAVDRSRSEVLLVNAPHGDYVLTVITRNQTDTSWDADNEGFQLLRDVSRLVWRHFEPEHEWRSQPFPSPGG